MRVNRGPLLPSESRPSQPTGTVHLQKWINAQRRKSIGAQDGSSSVEPYMEIITRDAGPERITRNAWLNYAKFCRAADSDSKVGMASTRRVTVRASRTRPGPQTRRSTPPSRASLMEMRTSVEMPELSICGMAFRMTTTFLAPPLTTDSRASWSCSAGSPMVSLPWTSSTDTPQDSRTLISMGNLSVMAVRQSIYRHAASLGGDGHSPFRRALYAGG